MTRTQFCGLAGLMLCLSFNQAVAASHEKEQSTTKPVFDGRSLGTGRVPTENKGYGKGQLRIELNQGVGKPDLIPSGAVVKMYGLSVVDKTCWVTLETKVKNAGTFVAGSSEVGFYLGGNLEGSKPVNAIGSGQTSSKKKLNLHGKKLAVAPGKHTFSFRVDDKGAVNESDEGNNTKDISCKCDGSVKSNKTHKC